MKNGWKKTLSLLLCLVLLAGLFPAALAEGEMCTVTFSTDGGHYLNPITAEKDSEITLPKAVWDDHYFLGWSLEYNGTVAYQAGDTLVLTEDTSLYAIWRDSQPLGLYAYWADTGESYAETTVPLNGSITLRVEAGVSAGELSYEWSCYGMDPSLLPGESSNIFTIDKTFAVTLKGVSEPDSEPVKVGVKTDLESSEIWRETPNGFIMSFLPIPACGPVPQGPVRIVRLFPCLWAEAPR